MPVPRVAIIGRPNVGKSSLLNLMARRKVAIVDPTPGVTRDRVSVLVELDSPDGAGPVKTIELTDTGGYGVYAAEGERFNEVGEDLGSLRKDIELQISHAVETADLILFCVDCQAGVTAEDQHIARLLRERRLGSERDAVSTEAPARVRMVATKCDGPKWEAHAYEAASLGFGEPLALSAKSNYFRRDFLDALWEMVPETPKEETPRTDVAIAIVGKRNAGKSTLVNRLAGEERVIVSEIAGTTRDAVDVRFELDGRSLVAIDTAGLRKKKSLQGAIEWYALDRAKRAVARADVVLLLIDATEPISQVDEQTAKMVVDSHKPVIIVVNKWDLAEGRSDGQGRKVSPQRYESYIRKELQGLSFAPIAFMSAKDGLNVRETMDLVFEIFDQASERVSTGQLNRLVTGILDRRGPSNKLGTEARVYYVSQVATHPPTIVLVVNRANLFTDNYQRYLMNRFREELPFPEVPIRLVIRERSRAERGERSRGRPAGYDTQEVSMDEAALDAMPDDASVYFDD